MGLLNGTWKAFRFTAKGTAVISDNTDLTISLSSTAQTVTFTPNGGVATSVDLVLLTPNRFVAANASYQLAGRVADTSGDVLTGYARTPNEASIDTFVAIKYPDANTPAISTGKYTVTSLTNRAGNSVLNDRTELIIKEVKIGNVQKWLIFLGAANSRPLMWITDANVSPLSAVGANNESNAKLTLQAVKHKNSTYNSLTGHLTWVGGIPMTDGDEGLGTDDSDSFTAVRVGDPPLCEEEGG